MRPDQGAHCRTKISAAGIQATNTAPQFCGSAQICVNGAHQTNPTAPHIFFIKLIEQPLLHPVKYNICIRHLSNKSRISARSSQAHSFLLGFSVVWPAVAALHQAADKFVSARMLNTKKGPPSQYISIDTVTIKDPIGRQQISVTRTTFLTRPNVAPSSGCVDDTLGRSYGSLMLTCQPMHPKSSRKSR